jgi:hypothetical protein
VVRISVLLVIFLLLLGLPINAQNEPAILLIRIVEGEGAVYPVGSRATRGVTVQVTDETGKPVDSATVVFRLPQDGPTGIFSSGMPTEVVTTGADGRANVVGHAVEPRDRADGSSHHRSQGPGSRRNSLRTVSQRI